jgi:hypothetical protein
MEAKGLEQVSGKWGNKNTESNDNGLRLAEEAALLGLCEASSLIRKPCEKRWTFWFKAALNEPKRIYDHILIPNKDRGKVKNVIVARKVLHDSDHCMVILDMKLPHLRDKKGTLQSQITKKLRSPRVGNQVGEKILLSNKFSSLDSMQNEEIQERWTELQNVIVKGAEEVDL